MRIGTQTPILLMIAVEHWPTHLTSLFLSVTSLQNRRYHYIYFISFLGKLQVLVHLKAGRVVINNY